MNKATKTNLLEFFTQLVHKIFVYVDCNESIKFKQVCFRPFVTLLLPTYIFSLKLIMINWYILHSKITFTVYFLFFLFKKFFKSCHGQNFRDIQITQMIILLIIKKTFERVQSIILKFCKIVILLLTVYRMGLWPNDILLLWGSILGFPFQL